MREILFRAIRIDDGEWVYGTYTCVIEGDNSELSHYLQTIDYDKPWDKCMYEIDPKTVCQFTGLKDKKGVKIFEWDICKNTDTGKVFCIVWHKDYAAFITMFPSGDIAKIPHSSVIEIIGNLFDTPHLLEVKP